jgi:hypothetical protein
MKTNFIIRIALNIFGYPLDTIPGVRYKNRCGPIV